MNKPTKRTQAERRSQYGFQTLCFALGLTAFFATVVAGVAHTFINKGGMPDLSLEYVQDYAQMSEVNSSPDTIAALRIAAKIDFDNRRALQSLYTGAKRAGDKVNVLFALRGLVRLYPQDPNLQSDLTMAYLDTGDAKSAVIHGDIATRLEPGLTKALSAYGAALMADGQKQEAADAYRRILEIDPDHKAATQALKYPLSGF